MEKMTTSKSLGRITLLKYCFTTLVVVMAIPFIIGLAYQIFTNDPISNATFYSNLIKGLNGNEAFVIIQVPVLLAGIWTIGGLAGEAIIDNCYPNRVIGFFTFFMLWILLFISCTLTEGLINYFTWGIKGIGGVIIGWLAYGLVPFIFAGIFTGLTIGLLYGNKLKNNKHTPTTE